MCLLHVLIVNLASRVSQRRTDYSISTYVASKFSEPLLRKPFPSRASRTNLNTNSRQLSSKVLIQKEKLSRARELVASIEFTSYQAFLKYSR